MSKVVMIWDKIITWIRLPKMTPMDFVEIAIIAVLIYYVIKWIKSTRAWVLVKGLVVLLAFWFIASVLNFDVILWLFMKTIGVGITALIILFQPELRKVLEQLGQRKIVPQLSMFTDDRDRDERFSDKTIEELVTATYEMAKVKTGALIVIEQDVVLDEYSGTGIEIDALVTSQLLINIFEKNTPLHDGAVIIRGNRVVSATCYLPLSSNMRLSKGLGTRHRAGVGISEETDSLTIIVSEQTGRVSLARGGALMYNVDKDFLRTKLQEIQKKKEPEKKRMLLLRRGKREKKA